MSLLDWLRQKEYPEDFYLIPPCREVANASQPFADLPATSHLCATENCDSTAVFIVSRNLRGKTVCRGCMENMTAFGWTLEGRL